MPCNKQIKKSYGTLNMIYPHEHDLNETAKAQLCNNIVLSQFIFSSSLYDSSIYTNYMKRIQKVLFVRFICEHVSHNLDILIWLNMANRRKLNKPNLYHKKSSYL